MQEKSFLKNAAIIAGGGFIAKILGALYRIPLTNLIGGEGIGLYQLAYPFYCLLLTVSATGIPSSIAALEASESAKGEQGKEVFLSAKKLFAVIGGIGTVLMILFSPFLSFLQGERGLVWGYLCLAPSVLLVSVLSVFRGWFQGKSDMFPTAVSEVLEQLVKVGIGLGLAYLYRDNVQRAVAAILFAVTLSEFAAFFFMLVLSKRRGVRKEQRKERLTAKGILKVSVFVSLSSALLPFSNLIESILTVRLLSAYAENAVALYGLFSGGAVTVVGLPVSLCYGVAVASVPRIAKAYEGGERGRWLRKKIFSCLAVTLAVSLPCALFLYFFAPTVVALVYRSLAGAEKEILIRLIKNYSISAITLSLAQTLSAVLTGLKQPKKSFFAFLAGAAVKLFLDILLLPQPKLSIMGSVIATNVCYFVAFFLCLVYNLGITKTDKEKTQNDYGNRIRGRKRRFDGAR